MLLESSTIYLLDLLTKNFSKHQQQFQSSFYAAQSIRLSYRSSFQWNQCIIQISLITINNKQFIGCDFIFFCPLVFVCCFMPMLFYITSNDNIKRSKLIEQLYTLVDKNYLSSKYANKFRHTLTSVCSLGLSSVRSFGLEKKQSFSIGLPFKCFEWVSVCFPHTKTDKYLIFTQQRHNWNTRFLRFQSQILKQKFEAKVWI